MHRSHAQTFYDATLLEYNNSICESISKAIHSYKWQSTLKTFLFDVNFSLPLIWIDAIYDPIQMAEGFSK